MTDQEKLNFKEKYQNNPVAFVEDYYNIKLYSQQKTYFTPYRYGKAILQKGQLEYMKAMEMDFSLWTKNGIEVYEKGEFIKNIKHENN